tara:strand:- start:577 stop:1812 length:1236 start_codon:yes stop_codon:yes gene_type:complete
MLSNEHNLKLLYISKYVLPFDTNGVGTRGFHLVREISKHNIHTTIITSDSNHLGKTPELKKSFLYEKASNVNFYWLKTLKYKKTKSIKRILSWIDFEIRLFQFICFRKKIQKPDIIIVSSLSLLTVISGLILKLFFKSKIVFEVRDIWPLTLIEEGGYSKFNPLILILFLIEWIGYKFSDFIVGTMPNLSDHVEQILGYKKDVFTIPMGFNLNDLEKKEDLSERFFLDNYPEDKFIVGYAGSIGITNALEVFFECVSSLSDEKNFYFIIYGDGDLKEKFIEKYGNLPNLSFMPKVEKKFLNSALKKCDLLYLSTYPSKVWVYGQSLNKLVDYMLSGRPILASYNGYPSMINEANCGKFIPAGDILSLKKEIIRFSKLSSLELDHIGKRGMDWIIKNREYKFLASEYLSKII